MSVSLPMESRYPPDQRFDGRVIMVLHQARNYLLNVFDSHFSGKQWPLEGYEVLFNMYPEHNCAEVSFCPKVDTSINGVPFEVADQGVWANGPGVEFFISLEDYSLLKTTFMR